MILRRGFVSAMLALIVFSATDTTAQNSGPFNYGKRWNAWSKSERSIYIERFRDGQSRTYFTVSGDLPSARRGELLAATFTLYDNDILTSVMTSLYADPANTFVQNDDMVYISRDKLNGKDIEPALRDARARGATPR
jgi:hypothetical protein